MDLSCLVARLSYIRHRHMVNIYALLFMMAGLLLNSLMLSFTHERVPLQIRPLPDLLFDFFPFNKNLIFLCELYITLQNIVFLILLVFHADREIILRRFMFLVGIIYTVRASAFSCTQLPTPYKPSDCIDKLNVSLPLVEYGSIVFKRSVAFSLTFGMVSQQQISLCGDYIFSGHSVMILLVHLFINTYYFNLYSRNTNSKCIFVFEKFHTILSAMSIVCISVARQHYTVDIVLSYYIVTELFWTYHSLCLEKFMFQELIHRHQQQPTRRSGGSSHEHSSFRSTNLIEREEPNFISLVWWWPLFVYFEIRNQPPSSTGSRDATGCLSCCNVVKNDARRTQKRFDSTEII